MRRYVRVIIEMIAECEPGDVGAIAHEVQGDIISDYTTLEGREPGEVSVKVEVHGPVQVRNGYAIPWVE